MRLILLTQGKATFVDDEDFARLDRYKWTYATEGYAYRMVNTPTGRTAVLMHRQIMGLGAGDKREVDHDDGNGLNNQKVNLRVCTKSQNQQNRRISRNNTSGYKGVSRCRRNGRWQAHITTGNRPKFLGYFEDPALASEFRNLAADMLHGEFANHG